MEENLVFPVESRCPGQFLWGFESCESPFAKDPGGITFDISLHAGRREGTSPSARAAFHIREPFGGREELRFLFLAAGAPVGAIKFCSGVTEMNGQGLELRVFRAGGCVKHPAIMQMKSAHDDQTDHRRLLQ